LCGFNARVLVHISNSSTIFDLANPAYNNSLIGSDSFVLTSFPSGPIYWKVEIRTTNFTVFSAVSILFLI